MQALASETAQGVSDLVWLVLLHSVWLGLALPAVVALLFQGRRTLSHGVRRGILMAALGAVVVGSTTLAVVQSLGDWRGVRLVPRGTTVEVVVASGASHTSLQHGPSATSANHARSITPPHPWIRSFDLALEGASLVVRAVRPFAVAGWGVVVLSLSGVLALGVGGVVRLRRAATNAPKGVQERARRLGRLLRLGGVPRVGVHPRLAEPCLCGALRPVVLLPRPWLASAGPEALDAVLAHELAHARRLDHLVMVAQRVVEALLFFHPGVHWLSRSLRRESEFLADALAARLTGDPLALARVLEAFARLRLGPSRPHPFGASLGGEHSTLSPRIQELIGMTPVRPRPQVWPFVALPLAIVAALVAVSVGFAEEDTAPPRDNPTRTNASVPVAKDAPPEADSDRQISLLVRWVDLAEQPWRDRLKDRLKSCGDGADPRGSLVDRQGMAEFLKMIKEDPAMDVVQAPKVTTFEEASAFISLGSADKDKAKRMGDRPGDAAEPGHSRVEIKGVFLPRGTKLNVDVRDSLMKCRLDPKEVALATNEVRYQGTCGVPDDSSLLISLGHYERKVDGKSVKSERLITITPRRIIIPPAPLIEGVPAPKRTPSESYSDRQVCYEVRWIELAGQSWRDRLKGRFESGRAGADARGAIVGHEGLVELLQPLQMDGTDVILQAPKVTSFEGVPALVSWTPDEAGTQATAGPRSKPRETKGRSQVEVKGSFLARGTRISVEMRDSTLKDSRDQERDGAKAATVDEIRYETSCDIPNGSSLLVGLGHHERQVDGKSVRSERLITITPRWIVLEPEENRLAKDPSSSKGRR